MLSRCNHYAFDDHRTHCEADATHYILTDEGVDIGAAYCEEHASAIITEYRDTLGWNWTMEAADE